MLCKRFLSFGCLLLAWVALFGLLYACATPPPSAVTDSPGAVLSATGGQPTSSAASPSPTPVPTQPEVESALPTAIATFAPDEPLTPPSPTPAPNREFDEFVARVKNGRAEQIVGVYVQGVLALPVVQQPVNSSGAPINPGYVSEQDNQATQFLYAYIYADGNVGLLAHNYLAGRYFFNMKPGDVVELIYGDGVVDVYVVGEIQQFQALSPRDPRSNFVDLDSGETLTSTELFYRVYGGEKRVTFQTCINRDNDSEWGRFFPIAFPGE